MFCFFKLVTCTIAALSFLSLVLCEKYRLCTVDGRGDFKKSARHCPALDKPDSKVECVVAPDRLDCLRQISKGKADFAVFTAEDLMTAENAVVNILVTNELRYNAKEKHEYEIVAVINNKSNIKSRYNLKGKNYCHPGYGYEADWTRILANYFEASVVPPMCNPQLTITENRIKASASYFKAACKAGPWANNPTLDEELKNKYPHLCELCGNPKRCVIGDEYWGRRGSLLCLTDGAGDVSWSRFDDIEVHFGLSTGSTKLDIDDYSLLCPDDTTMPLNSSDPCVWVVKPWPVIGTSRTKAQEIQDIIASLSYSQHTDSWRYNLLQLLETSYTTMVNIEPIESIESYLSRAVGFLNANSFSGCHPPRTIRICTTSTMENAKCSWLRESAAVYGIEPDLDCIKADNTTHCMVAVNQMIDHSQAAADVVMVPSDLVNTAISQYNLKTLFYETVDDNDKYLTVMVTRPRSDINSFEDVRGRKVCFPVYDGVAWNTVKHILFTKKLIEECHLDNAMAEFFGPSCTPGLPGNVSKSLAENCQGDSFNGDLGALHCLASGVGDVAFVSSNSIREYVTAKRGENSGKPPKIEDFRIVCDPKPCPLSWAPKGQAMVRRNMTDLWMNDTLDVFQQLDNLFGKGYNSLTTPFTMFGKYNGVSDLLFHDATVRLRNVPTAKDTDKMINPYEKFITSEKVCSPSSGFKATVTVSLTVIALLCQFF